MRSTVVLLLVVLALPCVPTQADDARRPASLSFENWVFWFHSNREWLDPPRTLPEAIDARVKKDVLPTIVWATDGSQVGHQAIQGAAYIALGKLARDATHVERLFAGVAKAPGPFQAVESATLGLGLLRRSDPARQLDQATLDRVRARLFEVIEDRDYPGRTRGMAAISIGLLGDQPTGEDRARRTTARLFGLLAERHDHPDVRVGLLVAIGAQQPDTLTDGNREVLRRGLLEARIGDDDARQTTVAFCAHALGRVGTADDASPLALGLRRRRTDRNVQRSCAVALGTLAGRVDAETRARIQADLQDRLTTPWLKDTSARNLAAIALARSAAADVRAGTNPTAVTSSRKTLMRIAGEGSKYMERPYAAIGIALIAEALPQESKERARIHVALRDGLRSKRLDARGRAAFAVALGLAGDTESTAALHWLARDVKEAHEVRAYSALALGFLGADDDASRSAVRAAWLARGSQESRIALMDALALLRHPEAGASALEDLRTARDASRKGQAVITLARLADPASIDELVRVVRRGREQDLTRMIAVSGLGRLADPEPRPSLGRITGHINYRLMTDLLNEVFGVL